MLNIFWYILLGFFAGSCGLSSSLDDKVGFPADIKLESTNDCMPEDDKDFKVCVVCGEKASGFYFGALVCLPCKVSYLWDFSVLIL